MIRYDLTKTIGMYNEYGTCLQNTLLRCILNSETLTNEFISYAQNITKEKTLKYLEKYGLRLFEHIDISTHAMKFVIGLYCDAYMTAHRKSFDLIDRMYYLGLNKFVNEDLYQSFKHNRPNEVPEYNNVMSNLGIQVYKTFPRKPNTDVLIIEPNPKMSIIHETYVCTDMILSVHDETNKSYQHVVYYNVLENILQNNNSLYYVPYDDLFLSNHKKTIGSYTGINVAFNNKTYSPILFHYQNMRGYKTRISEFLTRPITVQNILRRFKFLKDYVKDSRVPYELDKKTYIEVLDHVIKFYSSKHTLPELNAFVGTRGYCFFEEFLLEDGKPVFINNVIQEILKH